LLPDFALQGRDLLAQRGLRDMQDIGRLGEAANVDDLHEILQPPEIHAKASRTMPGDAWRNQALRRALSISVACIKAERTHLGHRDAELPAGCEARAGDAMQPAGCGFIRLSAPNHVPRRVNFGRDIDLWDNCNEPCEGVQSRGDSLVLGRLVCWGQ
jgi:hypothetical protein